MISASMSVDERTSPEEITAAAVASFDGCRDRRLRELMRAFVAHLHAFAAEVGLTEAEWARAIESLTATGHITDERRQEFILWSDALGLSMLVDALAHRLRDRARPSRPCSARSTWRARRCAATATSIAEEPAGCRPGSTAGCSTSSGGPIAGAELDVWQNGDDRLYAVQRPEAPEDHLRGRLPHPGRRQLRVRRGAAGAYPIPDDGPVGRMLAATGRHPWRPAHIHMIVRAPGLQDP